MIEKKKKKNILNSMKYNRNMMKIIFRAITKSDQWIIKILKKNLFFYKFKKPDHEIEKKKNRSIQKTSRVFVFSFE